MSDDAVTDELFKSGIIAGLSMKTRREFEYVFKGFASGGTDQFDHIVHLLELHKVNVNKKRFIFDWAIDAAPNDQLYYCLCDYAAASSSSASTVMEC